MPKVRDLTGQVFGRLTVISLSHVSGGKAHWNCTCTCGKNSVVLSTNLTQGLTKSCGCMRGTPGDGLSSARVYFGMFRGRTLQRNIAFELTFDQFYELSQQNCVRCGKAPDTTYKCVTCTNTFTHGSIGMHEKFLGYTQDNCFPSCSACNRKKIDA